MMTPVPWSSIRIDTSTLSALMDAICENEGENPACRLGPYWQSRRGPEMLRSLADSPGLPVGFVGNGWPEAREQTWATDPARDHLDLRRLYTSADLHTRDAGDAIYQCNRLWSMRPAHRPVVADLGAGYGRLAFPFVGAGLSTRYYAVDATPVGLLIAPQFIAQTTAAKVADWRALGLEADFVSLPAWRVDEVPACSVDLFVSVHSFQEMTPEAIAFYIGWAQARARQGALLYSVNIGEPNYIPSSWRLLAEQAFPCNRDGSYLERLWEIR